MTPDEFQFACLQLQDAQRLIAAGKVQRWDVLKWTMTVNLALAGAAATLATGAKGFLFFLTIVAAVIGGFLVWHYNKRMTGARHTAQHIIDYLRQNKIAIQSIQGGQAAIFPNNSGDEHDKEELRVFLFGVGVSILPAFVIWVTNPAPIL